MSYLLGEILTCLITALVVGILIGWLLGQQRKSYRDKYSSPGVARDREPNVNVYPRNQVESLNQSVANYKTEIDAAGKRERALNDELQAARERIAEQARQVQDLRTQHERSGSDFDTVQTPGVPGGLPESVPRPPDDLTEIHGIGPKIAHLLNELGITTFRQIAEFSEEDVRHIADALHAFPDRILRDGWVDDARRKQQTKYGPDGWGRNPRDDIHR
ncbi:MAG: hypothetical protein OES09_14050 [Gammaproteobacteria bacterium]|nr:hypothetical protein [Gammaproteobacteria bacterium]